MKWAYSLNFCGKNLREAINNGGEDLDSCKSTLQSLLDCYKQIQRLIPQDDWYEFENEQDNIEELLEIFGCDDVLRENRLLSCGYDEENLPLQATNERLRAFYDLCDYYRIWVGV